MTETQKHALMRDVAARIIQAYWRSWCAWRAKVSSARAAHRFTS